MISIIDLIVAIGALVVIGAGIYSARIKYNLSQEGQAKRLKALKRTRHIRRSTL